MLTIAQIKDMTPAQIKAENRKLQLAIAARFLVPIAVGAAVAFGCEMVARHLDK